MGIWSSPVAANRLKDGQRLLELRRLALCPEIPQNTASWMMAKMIKDIRRRFPDVLRLISYQDTEKHLGTIYKASNWYAAAESAGLSWTTGTRVRSKEQTRARKIRWEYELKGLKNVSSEG